MVEEEKENEEKEDRDGCFLSGTTPKPNPIQFTYVATYLPLTICL